MHRQSCFITLTYSPEHLPKDWSVDIRPWQLFAKKVRNRVGPFRFYQCAEYGDLNLRPHFHACIFGLDFRGGREVIKRVDGYELWRSPELESCWPYGFSMVGNLTAESAAYVARYVMKKNSQKMGVFSKYTRYDSSTGEVWDVRPEFATMSRNPGIGSGWFEKYKGDVFPSDQVVHQGRIFRPPRYYDQKLSESELLPLKAKRLAAVAKAVDDLTDRRLREREAWSVARLSQLARDL